MHNPLLFYFWVNHFSFGLVFMISISHSDISSAMQSIYKVFQYLRFIRLDIGYIDNPASIVVCSIHYIINFDTSELCRWFPINNFNLFINTVWLSSNGNQNFPRHNFFNIQGMKKVKIWAPAECFSSGANVFIFR